MEHTNKCGCGCDHSHESVILDENITPNELEFLHTLMHYKYLPIAEFVIKSSKESDFEVIALAPVFIRNLSDKMEEVKECGQFLINLCQKGYITLDYDIPLDGYGYKEYFDSEIYNYFVKNVKEGCAKENFLGDTPTINLGSMALTLEALKLFEK